MTWTLDRSSGARLGETRRQHALAQKQYKDIVTQCETLDTIISKPSSQYSYSSTEVHDSQPEFADARQTNLERQAARADAEIIRLEHMASYDRVLRGHRDRISKSREKLKLALSRRKKSVARWQKSLEHRGLPSTLSLSLCGTHHELQLDDDRRRLSNRRRKREELAAASRRIEAISSVDSCRRHSTRSTSATR